jgi:N-acetyl-gamma-glutamyl-phosphate reductase
VTRAPPACRSSSGCAAGTDLRLLTLPAALRKDPQRRAEALNRCDVAVLCLPDDAARDAVAWSRTPPCA